MVGPRGRYHSTPCRRSALAMRRFAPGAPTGEAHVPAPRPLTTLRSHLQGLAALLGDEGEPDLLRLDPEHLHRARHIAYNLYCVLDELLQPARVDTDAGKAPSGLENSGTFAQRDIAPSDAPEEGAMAVAGPGNVDLAYA